MKPQWASQIDPERHQVRFLAAIWKQRTGKQLAHKQMGQMRDLRKFLGEFTREVIEWMLDQANWRRFSQEVRFEGKLRRPVPEVPHLGFILWQRDRALTIMRRELANSDVPAYVNFCTRLDTVHYEHLKTFLLTFYGNAPEHLAKISAAKTLVEIQQVYLQLD